MALTSVRLPDHLTRELDALAKKRQMTRSDVVREALEEYCATAREADTDDLLDLVESLVDYPGSGVGDLAGHSEEHLRRMFDGRRSRR